MNHNLAPIALFTYNRYEHTKLTIEALLKNPEAKHSDLFIFSDAAKDQNDEYAVLAVRDYIDSVSGFKSLTIIKREINYGLAKSIIEGVTFISSEFGSVIVLEDDLETSPCFLKYMNDALRFYEKDERVGSISGYMYPISLPVNEHVFLAQAPQSWGWATWEQDWKLFEKDGELLKKRILETEAERSFEQNGPHSYMKMLAGQIEGKNDSWFIRWYASCLLKNKLTLMPVKSLVANIGIDGTGTHCADWKYDPFSGPVSNETIDVSLIIDDNVKTQEIARILKRYYKKIKKLRIVNFLYRLASNLRMK